MSDLHAILRYNDLELVKTQLANLGITLHRNLKTVLVPIQCVEEPKPEPELVPDGEGGFIDISVPPSVCQMQYEEVEIPGSIMQIEGQVGECNSQILTTASGDKVFTVKLSEEEGELLSLSMSPPDFVCDWRSTELFEKTIEVVTELTPEILDDETGEVLEEATFEYHNEVIIAPADWPKYEVQAYNEEGEPDGVRLQGAGKIL